MFFESLPQFIDQCQLEAVARRLQTGWCPEAIRDECFVPKQFGMNVSSVIGLRFGLVCMTYHFALITDDVIVYLFLVVIIYKE